MSRVGRLPDIFREHRYAGMCVGPQTAAILSGSRVPAEELGEGDSVRAGNREAGFAAVDEVKLVAARHHVGLDRPRRRDPVAWPRWRCLLLRDVADDRHAGIRVGPEAGAGPSSRGIPAKKVLESQIVRGRNRVTRLAALDTVEFVAVVHHVCLRRRRGLDA